jgi:hypothetical protein
VAPWSFQGRKDGSPSVLSRIGPRFRERGNRRVDKVALVAARFEPGWHSAGRFLNRRFSDSR